MASYQLLKRDKVGNQRWFPPSTMPPNSRREAAHLNNRIPVNKSSVYGSSINRIPVNKSSVYGSSINRASLNGSSLNGSARWWGLQAWGGWSTRGHEAIERRLARLPQSSRGTTINTTCSNSKTWGW
jgi:hypothetical protein